MRQTSPIIFLYPQWMKILGTLLITGGLVIFFYRIVQFNILDLTGASSSMAMGLVFIYFSRDQVVDERIIYLKFKSLAIAVPIAALVTMIINYAQNYNGYTIETASWFSISAFEYLTIAMCLAFGIFFFLKIKE